MQPIRVTIRAADPATRREIESELDRLKGAEPEGAELLEDTGPRPAGLDPSATLILVALVGGIAGGAGKKLGETAMTWLIDKVKKLMKKRKTSVTIEVGKAEVTVDEHSKSEELAGKIIAALDT